MRRWLVCFRWLWWRSGCYMDPQVTWNELQDAIARNDNEIARDHAVSLMEWLARGGFPPRTSDDPSLDQDAHREAARECCRQVLWSQVDG